jgi:hypothetical protein
MVGSEDIATDFKVEPYRRTTCMQLLCTVGEMVAYKPVLTVHYVGVDHLAAGRAVSSPPGSCI